MINELLKKYQNEINNLNEYIKEAKNGLNTDKYIESCKDFITAYNKILKDLEQLKNQQDQLFLEIRSHCTSSKQRMTKIINLADDLPEIYDLANSTNNQVNNILSKMIKES